ncbi:MAG: GatB/YqeY domain-containing protein [Chloroflexi bacterium]|nr:MAG: GatB/YqeY domain-containing protein [Chloroflexota bacterium]
MSLQTDVTTAMRSAMKVGDAKRVGTLRMAMAAAHNRQIELGHELTDVEMVEVLDRQVKQRRESIELFRGGGRPELAEIEEAEITILREFLPEPLSAEELERLARDAVAATGSSGAADMGKVMGVLVPQTKGRADGKEVSDLVRRLLSEAPAG